MKIDGVPSEIELERACWQCHGNGRVAVIRDGFEPCNFCRGTGYQLTEAGTEIIDLVTRHLETFAGGLKRRP